MHTNLLKLIYIYTYIYYGLLHVPANHVAIFRKVKYKCQLH